MIKRITVYIQYVIPQHLFTMGMGWLARVRSPWAKNWMIRRFIKKYAVDMKAAEIENPEAYPDFNHFFIRQLKANSRPITANGVACPVDGTVAEMGKIDKSRLVQAKHFHFDLKSLLGCDQELTDVFYDGSFSTLYLAPRDYHRVHMPLSGTLIKSIFIPGKLFSVNRITSEYIPNIFGQNERLVCLFNTETGPMVVILVGAMIVGSMQTVWMDQPIKGTQIQTTLHQGIHLQKGAELGHFKLGSTVIVLFPKNTVEWAANIKPSSTVQFGQLLAHIIE